MALSNRERISKALDHLRDALLPYISRELTQSLGPTWQDTLSPQQNTQDVATLLKLFMDHWLGVFKRQLGPTDRSYVSELLDARNRWAHQEPFSSEDTDRALDTAVRLCRSISAPEQADAIRKLRDELQQVVFTERARNRTRYQSTVENQASAGLQSWRDVIQPHPDVTAGKYQQAEFAADLDLVRRGIGGPEYTDPVEFYRRTFITSGLRELLRIALQRLNGQGGEPVIELQTNFGGGKTHSMLALYHLCSGIPLADLPDLESICTETGISSVPKASRAVLVGTAFSASTVEVKPDGTTINTLWGELAYQLGGPAGYAMLASSDQQRVAPGAQALAALFQAHAPCLILVDEWVAYARNLVSNPNLPAGTFDSQLSFAQALTEAAKQVPDALLLISVPQSVNEIGGTDGEKALAALKNVVTRIAYQWRPASGNEGFEIVRRRLFQPITTREAGAARDAVVRAFMDMYTVNKVEFPSETRETRYRDLLLSAYPIHPELFERLYEDWSTLDRFQRTRGVLRLLALTIEKLWNGNSKDLLIMPSSVPIDDDAVRNELVRFLDSQWEPILAQDVDGPQATPNRLDSENPNFGRLTACKRVARSLYIGTAPGATRERKGINDQRVKLACAMPGEPTATFGDALRRLGDRGRYIQQDGDRYWIDVSPNLNRTADDYRESYLRQRDDLIVELHELLTREAKQRGEFAGLHAAPLETAAVPDEPATRLVLVAAQYTHQPTNPRKPDQISAARQWADDCLRNRGSSPRLYANTLVFLAPDDKALETLLQALAERKAWQRVDDNKEELNLTVAQQNQAIRKIEEATTAIHARIPETWCHLLIPYQTQPGPQGAEWQEFRLSSGKGSLAQRASEKCLQEEGIYDVLGISRICNALNAFLWVDKPHVCVRDLVDWCRKYLYLPRPTSDQVILRTLVSKSGVLSAETTFYLADGFDEATGRYINLQPQQVGIGDSATLQQLIVRTEVAEEQIRREQAAVEQERSLALEQDRGQERVQDQASAYEGIDQSSRREPDIIHPPVTPPPSKPALTTYTGSLRLDPVRAGLQATAFLEEVMSHIQALPGAEIVMTLEVQARVPGGIDERTARIVLENSNALKVENTTLY